MSVDQVPNTSSLHYTKCTSPQIMSRIVGKEGTVVHLGLLRGPNKDFVNGAATRMSVTLVESGSKRDATFNPWAADSSKWTPEFEVDSQSQSAVSKEAEAVPEVAGKRIEAKERGGVGLTFYNDHKGRLVVKRVTEGGAADATKQIEKGSSFFRPLLLSKTNRRCADLDWRHTN